MMIRRQIVIAMALVTALVASDYERGFDAYEDGDIKTAISAWEKGDKNGDVESQVMLGLLYARGDDVEPDSQKAASLLAKAFSINDETLQITIGFVFYKNRGGGSDEEQAVELFETAIDKEGKMAQYNLGMLFVNGSGVNKDLKKGAALVKKAKDAGLAQAKEAWEKYGLDQH